MQSGINAYVFDMDSSGDPYQWWGFLSVEEVNRAMRLRFEKDRRRFIVRRGILRQLLAQALGSQPSLIPLSRNAFGKPLVREADLTFNTSHSQNIGLIALAFGREVGCDVAKRDPRLSSDVDPQRVFSSSEVRTLCRLHPNQQTEAFYNCWTRKEAYIKALGYGLSLPFHSFDVSLTPGKPAKLLRGCSGWSVRSFEPVPGFQAAVVARGTSWRLKLYRPAAGSWSPSERFR